MILTSHQGKSAKEFFRRDKHVDEATALVALLRACFRSTCDNLQADTLVAKRSEELLQQLRDNAPSLAFHHTYILQAGILAEVFYLKVNGGLSGLTLFRLNTDNVVRMPAQLKVVGVTQ